MVDVVSSFSPAGGYGWVNRWIGGVDRYGCASKQFQSCNTCKEQGRRSIGVR